MRFTLLFLVFLSGFSTFSQNLFKEVFEACRTERFLVESDSISIQPVEDLIEILAFNMDEEVIKEIRGVLLIQVVVDQKGRSCLLSAENSTNIPTKKLFLKEMIDQNLFWQWPEEDISVMIGMNFHKDSVQFMRLGLNEEKGLHPLQRIEP